MATVEEELADLRARAERKLDWQAARAGKYFRYYDGEVTPPGVILNSEERQIFKTFLEESDANWPELIVNAVAERLQVTGFRFGDSSDLAWTIWQASHMDADAELAQTDALVTGSAPVLVQADEDNPTGVSISAESPKQACVLYEPGHRYRREAGYKRWEDDDLGHTRTEILITDDWIATWHGSEPVDIEENPSQVVGMVELQPQPRTLGAPRSELKPVLPIYDRILTTIFSRLVATDYGAFRQVWAAGVRLAREILTGDDGEPLLEPDGSPKTRAVNPFNVGANRMLITENPAGRFGAIPESNLGGYLAAVEQDVRHLAAITQTPPHYLLGELINLSGDAIKAAEAGLTSKVGRRMLHLGEGWEEVMRVALGIVGDAGATAVEGEIVWKDPETRSESQLVDALTKMATLGVPREVLWQRWGATPQQIQDWTRMAQQEEAQRAANQAAALGAGDIAALLQQAGAGAAGATA